MPSESAAYMKKAYARLKEFTERSIFLTEQEEKKITAELEIQLGISEGRAKKMIDNMVLTGRLHRHTKKDDNLQLGKHIVVGEENEEKEIEEILKAKPKAKE